MAAIESDRGGFLPLGFTVRENAAALERIRGFKYLFDSLGMFFIEEGYGGVDINPLHDQGTLTLGLKPDSQRYFDVHHSANVVLSAVHERELALGAVATAVLAWVLSEEGL